MRSAKQKFLDSPSRVEFEKITNSPHFEEAINAALLQLVHELPPPTDPSRGWDTGTQIAGAKRVLEILCNLHLKDEPPHTLKLPQLKQPS